MWSKFKEMIQLENSVEINELDYIQKRDISVKVY